MLSAQLMIILDATVVNIALPHILTSLNFSRTSLSWVMNGYTLTFGGLLLLGGRAGDILGRRRVFVAGIGLFTLASLVGGLSTSAGMLLAARAVQGAGGALAAPAVLALIVSSFSEGRERTRALGIYMGVITGGSSLGLVLGGVITQWLSWRWVLFINVPMPTPARRAMSSSGASAPFSANAAVAAEISRARFCRASARCCSAGRATSWSDGLVMVLGVNEVAKRRLPPYSNRRRPPLHS